jgi:CxxC motif-containing protein (DUF1111 family)
MKNHPTWIVVMAATAALMGGQHRAEAAFGDPLPGLSAEQLTAFLDGQGEFNTIEEPEEGLGPIFNEASCGTCHVGPGTAIGGSNQRLETRFGFVGRNGVFDPMETHGGSLMQDHAIGLWNGVMFAPEQVPPEANVVAGRRTTPLFGLGLVDAVPDQIFRNLAVRERMNDRSTAGRASVVTNLATGQPAVGKFGWKAQVPTLFQFSGDAYLNEMGITSPLFPNENCPQGDCSLLDANPLPGLNDDGEDVEKFASFMTLLAPPPLPVIPRAAMGGPLLFYTTGCASCHNPVFTTGRSAITACDRRTFFPFSDFLLHDMGSLGDGIVQGDANGREMRTAPLWGLRATTRFLHDGRATTVRDAILAHDGQGAVARRRFLALRGLQQAALLAFVGSL